ncbi:DoxX family protein [Haloferax sulfurifontis]|uniref:DoxX family protein n=1 Tax=Haloferax sulfurifontis TaxID=255616 RepID=A0A830EAA3_9EURY|nr:DoxX family protein [Haloferax sulfurifontis]GGC63894.1 hypothetical protein GCM10007209_27440 [Haloferax sulfurifontis]
MTSQSTANSPTETTTHWSLLVVRLALGVPILISGVGKVLAIGPKPMGISGFAGFLASLGVPLPTVAAWGVGLLELVGGALLLAGLTVRVTSALIAIDMLVATVLYHLPNGYPAASGGVELTLTLCLVALALAITGPGAFTVRRALSDTERRPSGASQSRGTDR